MLHSPKLKEFLDWAQKKYDKVIIDCPAVLPITDTLLYGKYVQGVIFAIKTGSTDINAARNAIKRIERAGLNIMGIVLTMYKEKGLGYGHYYKYNYYYYEREGVKNTPPAPAETDKKDGSAAK